MRWTGRFLIVLTFFSLGCARGDWTTETLTLVDVTGTWEGIFKLRGRIERTARWVLQQKGGKVKGEAQVPDGAPLASIEGLVNGDRSTPRSGTGSPYRYRPSRPTTSVRLHLKCSDPA